MRSCGQVLRSGGVFRISVRRGRGAVGVERGEFARWTGLGPSPEKKIIFFVPKMTSLCILTQFLTDRKHGQSLEALGHAFYAKGTLQTLCKLSKKNHGQIKGAIAPSPPPSPNTPLIGYTPQTYCDRHSALSKTHYQHVSTPITAYTSCSSAIAIFRSF